MSASTELSHAAGQIVVGGFDGERIPAEWKRLAEAGVVGGAILFRRNISSIPQVAGLVAELSSLETDAPLWLAIDQEGGKVQRLRAPFPELPPMRRIGERGDETIAAEAGALLGECLATLGFHQDYAPVVDVDTNPANPVIGDRAFSRDPQVVARFGAAFIRAIQAAGVAACAKHFPGHGDTSTDSHLELPSLEHDLARLESVELVPFRAAAEAGVAAIMTAHVMFPALDTEHPATLSEKILRPLVRERMGYDGVVVSDDLEMKAVADHYGIEDSAVRAIRAGCDQLLVCHGLELQERAHRALIQAVEKGTLSRDRLMEAASRIGRMKARFARRGPSVAPEQVVASLPRERLARIEAALG